MTLRVISFDGAGTLFTVPEPVGATYSRIGRRHGLALEVQSLEAGFRRAFRAAPPLAFPEAPPDALTTYERRWWRGVVTEAFMLAGATDLPEPLFEELFAYYAAPAAWRCYDETLAVLASLHARRYRLTVVSNFDSRLYRLTQGLGISALVDFIAVSTRAGAAKPDPRIFHHALDTLGVTPDETVHVGDDPVADVDGARAAGLRAVLVDRNPQSSRPARPDVPVISSLAQLESSVLAELR